MTSSPAISVAIIGGGISGLTCGARLAQLGVAEATVFDTGARGPGGRCSSRVIQIDGTPHVFDHAVQYFTVGDSRFANIVSSLHKDRAVTQWSGVIQRLNVKNRSRVNDEKQKFIGDPSVGLASVARALARKCSNVQNPVWISHVRWHTDLKKVRMERKTGLGRVEPAIDRIEVGRSRININLPTDVICKWLVFVSPQLITKVHMY